MRLQERQLALDEVRLGIMTKEEYRKTCMFREHEDSSEAGSSKRRKIHHISSEASTIVLNMSSDEELEGLDDQDHSGDELDDSEVPQVQSDDGEQSADDKWLYGSTA